MIKKRPSTYIQIRKLICVAIETHSYTFVKLLGTAGVASLRQSTNYRADSRAYF